METGHISPNALYANINNTYQQQKSVTNQWLNNNSKQSSDITEGILLLQRKEISNSEVSPALMSSGKTSENQEQPDLEEAKKTVIKTGQHLLSALRTSSEENENIIKFITLLINLIMMMNQKNINELKLKNLFNKISVEIAQAAADKNVKAAEATFKGACMNLMITGVIQANLCYRGVKSENKLLASHRKERDLNKQQVDFGKNLEKEIHQHKINHKIIKDEAAIEKNYNNLYSGLNQSLSAVITSGIAIEAAKEKAEAEKMTAQKGVFDSIGNTTSDNIRKTIELISILFNLIATIMSNNNAVQGAIAGR